MTSASLIEKCCLIACPVAGNPTHYIVEYALAQQGLDWRFMTFEVAPDRLEDAMRGIRAFGFRGVKIAEPFQEAAIPYLDELSDRARLCGSVNTIVAADDRLSGDNTEGTALVELVREMTDPQGSRVLLLGAGRLGRAFAVALAEAGAASIAVASRSAERGQRLVDLLSQETPAEASYVALDGQGLSVAADVGLLVNATSTSASGATAQLPIEPASLRPPLVVADATYTSSRTWLTRQAAHQGCRVIDGLQIYVEQTAQAIRAWTGIAPDRAAMREAAEEFLGL